MDSDDDINIDKYLYDPDDDEIDNTSRINLYGTIYEIVEITLPFALFAIAIYVMARRIDEIYDDKYLFIASLLIFCVFPLIIMLVYIVPLFTPSFNYYVVYSIIGVAIVGLTSYQVTQESDQLTTNLSISILAISSLLILLSILSTGYVYYLHKRSRYNYISESMVNIQTNKIDF